MFLTKNILLVIILNIFIISTSFAQTITSTTGQFTFLKKGDDAPFSGALFDPVATARILAEKEMAEKKCQAKLTYEKDLSNAQCQRKVDLLESELEIEKRKNNIIVEAQQEEIDALRKLAKGSDNTLWATIGFTIGAVTSIAIFFAAVEVAR